MIAPIGVGDDGHTYNINADVMANKLANIFQAEKLILPPTPAGVRTCCIVDGRVLHAVVLEVFTNEGAETLIGG